MHGVLDTQPQQHSRPSSAATMKGTHHCRTAQHEGRSRPDDPGQAMAQQQPLEQCHADHNKHLDQLDCTHTWRRRMDVGRSQIKQVIEAGQGRAGQQAKQSSQNRQGSVKPI